MRTVSVGSALSFCRLVALLLLAPLALVIDVRSVHADHYEYTVLDPAKQFTPPSATRVKNFVQAWWVSGFEMWWEAEPSLHAEASLVIANWMNAIPQLYWMENTNPDYMIRTSADSTECLGGLGCHRVLQWEEWAVEDAAYILKGEIIIITNPPRQYAATAGISGLLAHELGHAYGLHERYLDRQGESGCNPQRNDCYGRSTIDRWP